VVCGAWGCIFQVVEEDFLEKIYQLNIEINDYSAITSDNAFLTVMLS